MDMNSLSSQELLEHSLFYSRREEELQKKLQQLLDAIDEDEEDLDLDLLDSIDLHA